MENTNNEENKLTEEKVSEDLQVKSDSLKQLFLRRNLKLSVTVINIITVSFGVLLAALVNYIAVRQSEKKEVDNFLQGLYQDLNKDHQELINDLASYKKTVQAFNYYYKLDKYSALHQDSIQKHRDFFYSYVLLFPNSGRYEGFKSSGKIYYIRNATLRDKILDFYQETVPIIIGISNHYNNQSERLRIYMEETDENVSVEELLLKPKGKIILGKCIALHYPVIKMYEEAIQKTEEIINTIEKQR